MRSVLLRNINRAAVQNAQKGKKNIFNISCFLAENYYLCSKNNKPNRRKTRKKLIHIRSEIQYSYDIYFFFCWIFSTLSVILLTSISKHCILYSYNTWMPKKRRMKWKKRGKICWMKWNGRHEEASIEELFTSNFYKRLKWIKVVHGRMKLNKGIFCAYRVFAIFGEAQQWIFFFSNGMNMCDWIENLVLVVYIVAGIRKLFH